MFGSKEEGRTVKDEECSRAMEKEGILVMLGVCLLIK